MTCRGVSRGLCGVALMEKNEIIMLCAIGAYMLFALYIGFRSSRKNKDAGAFYLGGRRQNNNSNKRENIKIINKAAGQSAARKCRLSCCFSHIREMFVNFIDNCVSL